MRKFRVIVKIPLVLTFRQDEPTEKTAEYVATKVGVYGILKGWTSQKAGWCDIEGESDKAEVLSVEVLK